MLFNSYEYLLFLPLTAILYSVTPRRWRWLLMLAASYWFYMAWKPEYIILIAISTLVDWICSINIFNSQNEKSRKRWLWLSLSVNLGILIFFKYYHFLNSSLGSPLPVHHFLLPMGISFYTFQTMCYTIDVYKGRLAPEFHLGKFALYVTYFPQLVAGPIERAPHLLPQIRVMENISRENFQSGLKRVVIGLFKKIVIADRVAMLVDTVYEQPDLFQGPQIMLATLFFGIQIFCDFSGYSDIAIGTSRIFGIKLMENFRRPYLSKSVREFWSRWHISLSSWFRDYVYIPLGGNRGSLSRTQINLLATFLISGLWHGANWTFVLWGAFHGVLQIIERIFEKHFPLNKRSKKLSRLTDIFRWALTMVLVFFGWMIFRADNIGDLGILIRGCLSGYASFNPIRDFQGLGLNKTFFLWSLSLIFILVLFQFTDRHKKLSEWIEKHVITEWIFYILLILSIILMGVSSNESQFIYFQF